MINMKRSHKESETLMDCCTTERPEYPYGLLLQLNEETLGKLGITDLPEVGAVMTLHARVEVVSTSQYEQSSGKNKEVGLQITDMDIGRESATANAQALYPNSNMA